MRFLIKIDNRQKDIATRAVYKHVICMFCFVKYSLFSITNRRDTVAHSTSDAVHLHKKQNQCTSNRSDVFNLSKSSNNLTQLTQHIPTGLNIQKIKKESSSVCKM